MIAFFFTINLIGCKVQKLSNYNEEIINKVKMYEENEYLVEHLEITYDQYKKNVEDIVFEKFSYKDNEMIFAYDGKVYKGIDLLGISIEEFKEHKENLEKHAKEWDFLPNNITYKISEVYDDSYREWKYIIVKRIMEYNNKDYETHVNIVYTCAKENDEWKIMNVSKNYISWKDEYEKEKGMTKKDYTGVRINNEIVEFTESFDPLKMNK